MFRIEKKFRGPCGNVNHVVLIDYGIAVGRERAAQTDVRIELAILIEIHDAQRIGPANFSTCGLDVAAQQSEQSRLAATVCANESHSHSRRHVEMNTTASGPAV